MSTENQVQCDYMDFAKAAEYCRETYGTKTHRTTPWRWAKYGKDGIYLEARRVGRSYRTTTACLDHFFARLAENSQEVSHG